MSDTLHLSRDAAAWAVRFYRDHFWLVFGLSMVPTVQRFWVIEYGPPTPIAIVSEVVVALARIALVVAVIRGISWRRFTAAIPRRRTAFLGQFVVLGLAFVVFDIIPTMLITSDTVNAVFVAAKNPTVIAFTMLWMAGIGHTLSTGGEDHADAGRELHYGTRE